MRRSKHGFNPIDFRIVILHTIRMIKSFRHKGLQAFFEKGSKGQPLQGHWSITVSGNWRLTFYFEGADAILVDYLDYH